MITEQVARFVSNTGYQDLPDQVVDKVKMCILDWLGCLLAAVDEPVAVITRKLVQGWGGNEQARVAGLPVKVPVPNAALVHGVMAHTIEFDDIYKDALYHPGAPVISAAFAVADYLGAPGTELVRAVALGYEVSNRLGAAVNPSHYRFWHTTGTVGTFGAAVAAAVLLNLSSTQIEECLGLAGTQAAGLWQAGGTMGKPFHAGKAAMNGVLAALLVKEGFRGPHQIIEGEKGFAAAMADTLNPSLIFAELGKNYTIMDVTHKYYPSCGHTHAAIDAALGIVDTYRVRPEEIRQIKVDTYRAALEVAGNPSPITPYEAKFSVPYCVAAAVMYGGLTLADFTESKLLDPEIRRLMRNTLMSVDEKIQAAFPGKRGARVVIDTARGTFSHAVSCRRGDPENPLTWSEIKNKFKALAGPYLKPENTATVIGLVLEIDRFPDVSRVAEQIFGLER
ncbi:MmgE/PrpD family protein [Desulfofundulus kuznetsovii DSM 6115]|uniref:MmgE/PrpD family protein n=1 Tax=Desulfofundulus kuznetsovii (strain DSM 6115 / VKM B-1805 / 17) TaxID=760568 RepID=A0AAU8PQB2_DESK7|nr:MmgE/PrpD family protein [Desulfofundulus kuznetsovii DSM 6115]